MKIQAFFDDRTYTLTYVVFDQVTRDALVIDPVLDYDATILRTWTESVDEVIAYAEKEKLRVHYVLETHAHADHLSGAQRMKEACPKLKIGIGQRITEVQRVFKNVFGLGEDFATDGRQFDVLLQDGNVYEAGSLRVLVIATPGHTPACCTYKIGDALFTGDTIFMPDSGTGRCDFPGGSAVDLYRSIMHKLYTHPDETRVFVGHDYQPQGRQLAYESTIGEEKSNNMALRESMTEQEFVTLRNERDASLRAPALMFQSVQVNITAGHLPLEQPNGILGFRMPINAFELEEISPHITVKCRVPLHESTQN